MVLGFGIKKENFTGKTVLLLNMLMEPKIGIKKETVIGRDAKKEVEKIGLLLENAQKIEEQLQVLKYQ